MHIIREPIHMNSSAELPTLAGIHLAEPLAQ